MLIDKLVLSPEAKKAIENIISRGNNAKVTTGKNGLTVYEEKVNKVYTQSQERDL